MPHYVAPRDSLLQAMIIEIYGPDSVGVSYQQDGIPVAFVRYRLSEVDREVEFAKDIRRWVRNYCLPEGITPQLGARHKESCG